MNLSRLIVAAAVSFCVGGCSEEKSPEIEIFSLTYGFDASNEGWDADFTDYPVNPEPYADTIYQWSAGHAIAPTATNGDNAFKLSCRNLSGDVFMFLKTKIGGLKANTNYNIVYEINLSSNALPGQGIILKAGASDLEPKKVIEDGYYVLNIDKGLGTNSGENCISFGDIGTSYSNVEYSSVTKGNSNALEPFLARTNSKGELWLVLGADSLYQGMTTIYFTRIVIYFSVSQ